MLDIFTEIISTYFIATIIGLLYIQLLYFHGDFVFKAFRNNSQNETTDNYVVKVFVGAIIYGMVLFLIGILRILFPAVVITYSASAFVVGAIYHKCWKLEILKQLSLKLLVDIRDQKWNYIGLAIFYCLSLIFVFRPITNFDALWYHITIPKIFLQEGNIDYIGEHVRYSVHPYINFFWNLLPLSLPFSTIVRGIIINFYQQFLMLLSFYFLNKQAKSLFNWSPIILALAPVVLGLNNATLFYLGAGYNDLYGLTFGVVAIIYILGLIKKENPTTVFEYCVATTLIIGLFLLKIFFGIFALILYIYFITSIFSKFTSNPNWKNKLKNILICNLILFAIFILPWLIRSYYFTGRILDPIGMPGLNEDAYNYAGSGTAGNHWSNFIFTRFYTNLLKIFIDVYTPVMLFGLVAIFSKKIRTQFTDLWLLGISGFFAVYFVSIVTEWRYFYAAAAIIMILGLTLMSNIVQSARSTFSKIVVISIPALFILLLIFGTIVSKSDIYRDLYLIKRQTQDEFIAKRNGTFVFDYYKSKNSPVPNDLSSTEKIFIGNVHNMGYIENPILEPRVRADIFKNLENVESFVSVIKSQKVRFMLVKRITLSELCRWSGVKDYDSCQSRGNKYWEEGAYDKEQQATWLKIK